MSPLFRHQRSVGTAAGVLTAVTALAGALVAVPVGGAAAAVPPSCYGSSTDLDQDTYENPVVGVKPSGFRVFWGDGSSTDGPTDLDATFGDSFATVTSFQGDEAHCAMLAVGAPGTDVGGKTDAGAVHIFEFSFDEPGTDHRSWRLVRTLTQGSDGVPGTPQAGARFGAALAGPDIDFPEESTLLAIGAPGQTVAGKARAGSVTTLTVPVDGDVTDHRVVTRGANARAGDALGASLAADVSRQPTPHTLVVAGAPSATVSGTAGAGAVLLIPDADAGQVKEITQNSANIPGAAEKGDGFGTSVAVTNSGNVASLDIGAGAPGEDVGTVKDAGSVIRFRAKDVTRIVSISSYSQATAGVQGSAERGDRFGSAVSPMRQNVRAGFFVGVPGEDVGSVTDAGSVQTVGVDHNLQWSRASAGVPGNAEPGDRMGSCLSTVESLAHPLIGVPGRVGRGVALEVPYGTTDAALQYTPATADTASGCPVF